jgi:uncharacterized Zn-binding protein involved in type VI secretion
MPIATILNLTATGDVILGPGAVSTLVKGLPVACMGDAVSGALCVAGVITITPAMNVLAKGRPTACIGSVVTGVMAIGLPVVTAVALCPNVNELAL